MLGLLLTAGALLAPSAYAGTPNTTAAGAVSYEVGEGWVTQSVDEGAQDRWFVFREVGGRSYCVEAAIGVATYFPLDPNLTLYSDTAGTTQLATNTDGASEPPMNKGARICYASPQTLNTTSPPTTALRAIKVNVPITAGSGDSGFVRLRVLETTLVADGISVFQTNYEIVNTGTTSITGAFYAPGTGKSTDITVNAERVSTAGVSTVFSSVASGRTVYFMHNGPANAVFASIIKVDSSGKATGVTPMQLRRD